MSRITPEDEDFESPPNDSHMDFWRYSYHTNIQDFESVSDESLILSGIKDFNLCVMNLLWIQQVIGNPNIEGLNSWIINILWNHWKHSYNPISMHVNP